MENKKVAEIIGCHERTVRRMSPRKRKKWQALAAKGRTLAWFDIIAQLMFEVEAFNASNKKDEGISINLSTEYTTMAHYDTNIEQISFIWIHNIDQLTEALFYVYGLNGGEK